MSKTKELFIKLLLMMAIIMGTFMARGEEAFADTSITSEKGVVIKTSNLKGGKVIVAPKKVEISENKLENKSENKTVVVNRGSYVDNGSLGNKAVNLAFNYIGIPYVYGAEGPNAFDCSGLTMYIYGQLGYKLPHYTGSQWNMGVRISDKSALLPGDLVFFNTSGPISHVGIYIGEGKFIHAPSSGKTITVADLNNSYYTSRYAGAVRIGA